MNSNKRGLFVREDGSNLVFTFILVSSLFFMWAVCNGMIDVMDKHFQEVLHLSKSQSAWVQFAHYLGYFLMSMPAGVLATKLGYKRGIIAGLLIVAVGGFWFIPATHINAMAQEGRISMATAFIGYLAGVCVIASGLTFLETIANPYTTVLGDKRYAATRINLAQSCNGAGWILGPIIGSLFFYSKDAAGNNTGSETLYIPYVTVAIIVVLLAVVFAFAKMPDIQTEDEFHLDESNGGAEAVAGEINRPLVYGMLWLNSVTLMGACGVIVWLILQSLQLGADTVNWILGAGGAVLAIAAGVALIPFTRKVTSHSVWAHPHFTGSIMAQFLYVAAQAGIFSFFINYMTAEVPPIPHSWAAGIFQGWFETSKAGIMGLSDRGASQLASVAFVFFLAGRVSGSALVKKFPAHKVLGLYGLLNVLATLIVFLKLGWLSVACVFLSYFFMSIMFPTIFALGIHGLGARAKRASAYIVMAIMGGAVLPKLMGYVADKTDMSRGFIVPMVCFAYVAFYGFNWSKFSRSQSLTSGKSTQEARA
ncbi:MAG TPA: MFS transporter [Bryobacteraceae bacterium]|nr:MFS transporter [Bryobacteraceae bacterium]